MDILGGLSQPVSFYTKNTENSINTVISGDNQPVISNVFSPELNEQISKHNMKKKNGRKNRNKRLNTIDSDYLPDEAPVETSNETNNGEDTENNIFVGQIKNSYWQNIKKSLTFFLENTPLINYFFLKKKKIKIQKTVKHLNDISQNIDEMLNTMVPYGEEKNIYSDIANNLTEAANIIGQANRDI